MFVGSLANFWTAGGIFSKQFVVAGAKLYIFEAFRFYFSLHNFSFIKNVHACNYKRHITESSINMDKRQWGYFLIPSLVIALVGAVMNILLLIVYIKDPLKCFRNSATYLVTNLAISDFVTCSFFLLFPLILRLFGQNRMFEFFIYWLMTITCVSIASIPIDRFIMVAYPIKHRILMKGRFMILWFAAIWIVSSLPSVLMHYVDNNKIFVHALYVFNVIVIMVSAVMYSLTYYQMKKQSRNISLQNSSEGRAQEIRIRKEKRFLNTIVIISFFSLVPTMALYIIAQIYFPQHLEQFGILRCVVYANFAINPLIYILRLPNYRKSFSLLHCRRASWPDKY